jgi:hypothetical protein
MFGLKSRQKPQPVQEPEWDAKTVTIAQQPTSTEAMGAIESVDAEQVRILSRIMTSSLTELSNGTC